MDFTKFILFKLLEGYLSYLYSLSSIYLEFLLFLPLIF